MGICYANMHKKQMLLLRHFFACYCFCAFQHTFAIFFFFSSLQKNKQFYMQIATYTEIRRGKKRIFFFFRSQWNDNPLAFIRRIDDIYLFIQRYFIIVIIILFLPRFLANAFIGYKTEPEYIVTITFLNQISKRTIIKTEQNS